MNIYIYTWYLYLIGVVCVPSEPQELCQFVVQLAKVARHFSIFSDGFRNLANNQIGTLSPLALSKLKNLYTLWVCRLHSSHGQYWRVKSMMIHWVFTAVISIPILYYRHIFNLVPCKMLSNFFNFFNALLRTHAQCMSAPYLWYATVPPCTANSSSVTLATT